MKRNYFLIILLISMNAVSQSFIGFDTDNYSGVNSVTTNPANIVDSRFKTDINLFGVSALIGNDYFGANIFDAIKEDYDFDDEVNQMPSEDNNLAFNTDIMGPSFMFNIDKENSVAIFTRVRSYINFSEFNGETVELFEEEDELDENRDYLINEEDFNITAQAWAEIGVSYARVILNEKEHFLKGGLSLKYLKGLSAGYVNGTGLNLDYDADGTNLPGGETTGSVEAEGDIVYAYSDDFQEDDDFELPDASGFGIDLGIVYEWRPDYKNYDADTSKDKNKYKLKLGFSITDIGSIKYKEGTLFDYTLNAQEISEEEIENIEEIEDLDALLDDFYTLNREESSFKSKLPTALHLNADWSFNKHFYVNLNTDLSFVSKKSEGGSRISNMVSLVPRFETKWFSFYLPLSVIENSGFQAGAGLRAGPLYVGSGSILTNLTSDNSRGADFYAGIKIPIYQGSPKDRDNDGIINKLDNCPSEAGPKENNGCPWGDKDGDGVLDNVDKCIDEVGTEANEGCPVIDKDKDGVIDKYDKCPEVPGLEENNGCPIEDKDEDGVFDEEDECPEVAGPKENKGCPWGDKDNDGVLDNVDKCPETPGVIEREGCPAPKEIAPIKEEKLKELQSFAKAIYFNSGRATFKLGVTGNLDLIANIMNEYPNAVFNIEGHTDSQGSATTNRALSEKRAKAVLDYLISKGVASSRISSIGYGEDYPIADNNTRDGRAQNRRVEVKLRK